MTTGRHLLGSRALWLAGLLPIAATACKASSPSAQAEADGVAHTQCPVCKTEGDLACVDVKILPGTPSTRYRGDTYWFCSQQCKADFEKQPERYLGH
jgi:uncharacterized protein